MTANGGKRGQQPADESATTGAEPAAPTPAGPSTAPASPAPRPPYEKARDELTDLVKRLEAGGLTLEQSLALWERGERLASICEEWLEGARARLAAATSARESSGTPGTPF